MDKCDVPNCKSGAELTYYRHGVCNEHFGKHCDEKSKFDLKEIFKISSAKKEQAVHLTV